MGFKIEGLADPSGAQDASTKNYVDARWNSLFADTGLLLEEEFLGDFTTISSDATNFSNGWTGDLLGDVSTISRIIGANGVLRCHMEDIVGPSCCGINKGLHGVFDPTKDIVFEVLVTSNVTGSNDLTGSIGLRDDIAANTVTSTNAIEFFVDLATNSNLNWWTRTRKADSEEIIDTGISSGAEHTLRFVLDSVAGEVLFTIDGGSPVTNTTQIPIVVLDPVLRIRTTSTDSRNLDVDYVKIAQPVRG